MASSTQRNCAVFAVQFQLVLHDFQIEIICNLKLFHICSFSSIQTHINEFWKFESGRSSWPTSLYGNESGRSSWPNNLLWHAFFLSIYLYILLFCYVSESRGSFSYSLTKWFLVTVPNQSHSCVKLHSLPLVQFSHSCDWLRYCTINNLVRI